MPNFNKLILAGHLTRDVQISYLPSQTAVADFGIAVTKKWKDQSGQTKEKVCFVDCKCFGKSADTLNKYAGKGSPILLEGELDFDQWTDQQGNKKSKHRMNVLSFQFLGESKGKPEREMKPAPDDHASEPSFENNDDSIPF